MSKAQAKPLQEAVEKVKKVIKPKPLVLLDSIGKQEKTVKVVKAKKPEPVKKPVNKQLDKLSAHALKHLSGWHSKAGENGPEFAKLIAKHARSLLK